MSRNLIERDEEIQKIIDKFVNGEDLDVSFFNGSYEDFIQKSEWVFEEEEGGLI